MNKSEQISTGWAALLARTRARRDRLVGDGPEFAPAPAPAHELMMKAIPSMQDGLAPLWIAQLECENLHLTDALCHALFLAVNAGDLAERTGTLKDRQLADDTLTLALRIAGRVREEEEGPDEPRH
jgi:hypothetical protein